MICTPIRIDGCLILMLEFAGTKVIGFFIFYVFVFLFFEILMYFLKHKCFLNTIYFSNLLSPLRLRVSGAFSCHQTYNETDVFWKKNPTRPCRLALGCIEKRKFFTCLLFKAIWFYFFIEYSILFFLSDKNRHFFRFIYSPICYSNKILFLRDFFIVRCTITTFWDIAIPNRASFAQENYIKVIIQVVSQTIELFRSKKPAFKQTTRFVGAF